MCLILHFCFFDPSGDPNRSDIWGNTPLHHAASNGHIHIISFLVIFGANLFALDNDFHTPMDVAASRDQMDCVRLLDNAASKQTSQNSKKVEKLKQQAIKDAEQKFKMCEKVKKRHQSKMEKMYRGAGGTVTEASIGSLSNAGSIINPNDQFSKIIAGDTSVSIKATLKGTLQRFGKKDKGTLTRPLDSNVIFVKQDMETTGKPDFVEIFNEDDENYADEDGLNYSDNEDGDESGQAKESVFHRPGLGKMVFRKNFSMEMGVEPDDFPSGETEDLGFLIRTEVFETTLDEPGDNQEEDNKLPWNQEEIGLDEEYEETSPLDSFLTSINLLDFAPVFIREQLDLEALMLCSDEDLKSIRIQLGPRKKILEAAAKRKATLEKPGIIKDTIL